MTTDALLETARSWIADDPDAATRAELEAVVAQVEAGDAAARTDLENRFAAFLEFGTAGLRGALGAGPNRMNRVVVLRAAAGLTRYLQASLGRRDVTVVIGFDARHNSDVFAADTAAVVTAAGGRALVLPRPLPTPVLAFAIRHLGADAGVMVTASHNPPQDNGYKVYLGGPQDQGSLIVPPADADISACIEAVGPLSTVPRPQDGWQQLDTTIRDDYLDAISSGIPATRSAETMRIVVTPMHGVGGEVVLEALRLSGFPNVTLVSEQALPDPDFPSVSFPNPEEPGAIDLALRTAAETKADLVIALDPDADRCAAAVWDPAPAGDTSTPGWRMLRGDELGSLLGEWIARRRSTGELPADAGRTLARSLVSSTQLDRIAERHGLSGAVTLTGFKWISRAPDLLFGYEEALGLCPRPDVTRDKDGMATAVQTCAMAAQLLDQGRTVPDALDELALTYGLHATDQLSVRVEDLSLIGQAMQRLRGGPPSRLAGAAVTEAVDLADGHGGLPPTDGILLRTERRDQVVTRPSGTEPKLKCYLEVVEPVTAGDVAAARRAAAARLAAVKAEMAAVLGV